MFAPRSHLSEVPEQRQPAHGSQRKTNQNNRFFWGRDRGKDILEGVTVLLSMLMALMGTGVFQISSNITVKLKQSTKAISEEEEEEF